MTSWSAIRKTLEEDLLCEGLRGRVQYFFTVYHGAPDHYGRFAVRIDGQEAFRANPYQQAVCDRIAGKIKSEREIPDREWNGKEFLHDAENLQAEDEAEAIALERGIATSFCVMEQIENYLQSPVGRSLERGGIGQMLALLDRRVGKRTLQKIANDRTELPAWLLPFLDLRLEAEGL